MYQPRHRTQQPNIFHLRMHSRNGKVLCCVVQLFKVPVESNLAHHIETVVSRPLGNVNALVVTALELLDQYVDFSLNLRLVAR